MKIAIWHNLPSGGGKRALYDQVKGLVERGHYLESWCPSTADQSYLPLSELITEHILPFTWLPEQVSWFGRELANYRNLVGKLRTMDRLCRVCADEINLKGFDILFVNSCQFFRTPPIGRYGHIPKILYLQEPYRWLYEALPELPWVAYPPPRRFWWSPRYLRPFLQNWIDVQALRVQAREELWNARAFDRILVNSYFSRESILRAYGLNAVVCYLGVNANKFIVQQQPKERLIISVGSLTPGKNPEFLIRTVALISEPRPKFIWVANIQDAYLLSRMIDLAKSLNVEFIPKIKVSDNELIDLYNRALLMIYAPRLEPFGYAPLEANACGLPVVATSEGGVRETVINGINGLLVDYDKKMMADAIQKLIDNPTYVAQLGRSARDYVLEKWDFNKSIDRLEEQLSTTFRNQYPMDNYG